MTGKELLEAVANGRVDVVELLLGLLRMLALRMGLLPPRTPYPTSTARKTPRPEGRGVAVSSAS